MVRHTFSSGELYGPNRRSLRSDKTSCASGTQMNTDTSSWKNLLPTARRASLPPFSNGHHLRSSKVLEKTAKPMGQNDSLEVECNGINSCHSYGTRFCAKNAELIHQKLSPTRKNNHWNGRLGIKHKRRRTTSSFSNVPEGDQLSPTVSDLGHKLRSRHVWLPNNIITITPDEEDSSHHSCMKPYDTFSLAGDIEDNTEDFQSVLTGNNLNSEEEDEEDDDERGCKSSDLKHRQNQIVKRKRLTAEEKLIEDNKAYYKLEVKNSKLRSSGYYLHQRVISTSMVNKDSDVADIEVSKETAITLNGEQTEKFCSDDSLKEKLNCAAEAKRNKIRLSELSLLNNEAENFMFGEPTKSSAENSSNDDSDYGDSKNIENRSFCGNDAIADDSKNNNAMESDKCRDSVNESKVESKEKFQTEQICKETSQDIGHKYDSYSQYEMYSESCIDGEPFYQQKDEKGFHDKEFETNSLPFCPSLGANSVDNLQRRQRRRGCVESQTQGNTDSFKCELSGLPGCNEDKVYPHTSLKMQNKLENENRNEGLARMTNEHNPCRSENANESAPFSNCDSYELQTCSSKVGDCDENKDIRMQSGSKPPEIKSEAVTGLHFSFEGVPESEPWYQTYQRQDEGAEFYLSTVNDCTYWKSFLLPYEMPPEQFNTLSSGMGVPKTAKVNSIKRRKRKHKSNLLDKKPRKSPRCHASTLAILSSLMHHKKGKESESTSDDNLSKIAEDDTNDSSTTMKTNNSVQQKGIKELAQNIDQLLDLYTEIGLSSESHTVLTNNSNDTPEEVNNGKNHKYKTLKYKRPHKTVNAGNVKRSETDVSVKDADVSDVDPIVLEELAVRGENPFSSVDDTSIRSRGGPYMDVVSLLNGYGSCCCVEGLMKCKDISRYNSDLHPSLKETCHGCASSTGETVRRSGVIRVRGKKRKKKKNLTGWPVEKQKLKLKRRLLLKLARPELQIQFLEVKSKDESANETGVSNSEVHKNTCVPCIEVKKCQEGTSKQPENSGSVGSMSSSCINEVCTENVSRKIADSGYVDSVDTNTEEIRTSYNEYVSPTEVSMATSPARTSAKLCVVRNPSVDSNSQHCDFQPRVRVKKINSVDDINFVLKSSSNASSVNNTRQLRSASFSPSATLRKNSCHFDSVDTMEVVRRASGRMKKSCSRWDSWSTRRRR